MHINQKLVVSIMVLFIFGFDLISEVVFSRFKTAFSHASINDSTCGVETGEIRDQSVSSDTDNHMNACHQVQCHFGHCSSHVVSVYDQNQPSLEVQDPIENTQLIPDSIFLEGFKRPPRLS